MCALTSWGYHVGDTVLGTSVPMPVHADECVKWEMKDMHHKAAAVLPAGAVLIITLVEHGSFHPLVAPPFHLQWAKLAGLLVKVVAPPTLPRAQGG